MNQRDDEDISKRMTVSPTPEARAMVAMHTRARLNGKVRWLVLAVVAGIALAAGLRPPSPATAAFPGANGKIAFVSYRDATFEIHVMNADGSGQTNLTNHPAAGYSPAWSPDGAKVAFQCSRDGSWEVCVMNADGSGQTNLTNHPAFDGLPAWSPDGAKIAFVSDRDGNLEVYVMNADGSGQTNLTNHPTWDSEPAWSPDGAKIAFVSYRDGNNEVYVMNADGSGQTNLTNHPAWDSEPAWSPDGAKIAFTSIRDGNAAEVYVMNADGSGQTNLTNHPAVDYSPAWSPDGAQIAFVSERGNAAEVYVMIANGSGQTNLTNHPAPDSEPDWQPLVGTDTTPPVVTCSVKPTILQPADHKMRSVSARVTVTDEGSGPAGFVLMSVVSSEPDAGLGPDDRPHDIEGFVIGTADTVGKLRAERADGGSGRVYTLTYRGMDVAGNVAECAATVTVPVR